VDGEEYREGKVDQGHKRGLKSNPPTTTELDWLSLSVQWSTTNKPNKKLKKRWMELETNGGYNIPENQTPSEEKRSN